MGHLRILICFLVGVCLAGYAKAPADARDCTQPERQAANERLVTLAQPFYILQQIAEEHCCVARATRD